MSQRRVALTVLCSAMLPALVACAAFRSDKPPQAEATKPLQRLMVNALPDRLRVELDAGQAVTYSMSSTIEPATVTLTLPGLSKGTGLQRMELKQPPVLEVVPTEVSKPKPALELTFRLSAPVKPEIRIEGTRLHVDFVKGQQEPARTAQAESAGMGESATASLSRTLAKTMTKVEVQRDETEATVIIHGDGEFHYDVKPLNHDRLVVDLANVVSPLKLQVLPVDHPLLKQIRVGHHSRRIRLVFDLPKAAT
jgi:hypothetical protein